MSNHDAPISLESYATVTAGLGVGLGLLPALDHAGVEPSRWETGAEHWQAAIDESAATDLALLVAFDGALLEARRRLGPTIEPIQSDARAWAQFRRHFVTAVDPVAFLAERELSLSTYARLEGEWAGKLLADEALAEAFAGHMAAPLEACPALTLVPSPWLVPRAAASAMPEEEEDDSAPPTPLRRAPAPAALPVPPAPAPQPAFAAPLATYDATETLPVELMAHLAKEALPFAGATPESPQRTFGATAALPPELVAQLAKIALPFTRNAAPGEEEKAEDEAEQDEDLAADDATATLPVTLAAQLATLAGPSAGKAPAKEPNPFGETSAIPADLVARITGAALPFPAKPPPRAPNPLEATGMIPADLVARIARGALPFPAHPSSDGAASGKDHHAASSGNPATAPLAPIRAPAPALPFQPPPSPPVAPATPVFTLDQYASLCAEVAVAAPGQADAVFQRHGLGGMRERLSVDLQWRERLRRDPVEYRSWQELYQRYQVYWAEQHRRNVPR